MSRNPDRARHVTTSVRELFSQVLHGLAPDEEVRAWSSNEQHFQNRRPTRRARLLYICRHINSDPLTRFVEDDVQAALSFVEALNADTLKAAMNRYLNNDRYVQVVLYPENWEEE